MSASFPRRWRNLPCVEVGDFYVYALWGTAEEVPLYVGKSSNVLYRVGTHLADPKKRYHIRRVTVMRCASQADMDKTEIREINKLKPTWNRAGFEDKPLNGYKARPWDPQPKRRSPRKGASVRPDTSGNRRVAEALEAGMGEGARPNPGASYVHFITGPNGRRLTATGPIDPDWAAEWARTGFSGL